MSERERLIKELESETWAYAEDGDNIPDIADFILADRLRILSEIERPLREVKDINEKFELEWGNCLEHKCIDTALKAINRAKGEGK